MSFHACFSGKYHGTRYILAAEFLEIKSCCGELIEAIAMSVHTHFVAIFVFDVLVQGIPCFKHFFAACNGSRTLHGTVSMSCHCK